VSQVWIKRLTDSASFGLGARAGSAAAAQTGCHARGAERAEAARLPEVGRIKPRQLRINVTQTLRRSSLLQPGSSVKLTETNFPLSVRAAVSGKADNGGTTKGPSEDARPASGTPVLWSTLTGGVLEQATSKTARAATMAGRED